MTAAATEQLDVPTCRRSTIRSRAFPVAGAKMHVEWSPSDVTSASSLSVQAEDLLVPPLLRNCLTLNYISFS